MGRTSRSTAAASNSSRTRATPRPADAARSPEPPLVQHRGLAIAARSPEPLAQHRGRARATVRVEQQLANLSNGPPMQRAHRSHRSRNTAAGRAQQPASSNAGSPRATARGPKQRRGPTMPRAPRATVASNSPRVEQRRVAATNSSRTRARCSPPMPRAPRNTARATPRPARATARGRATPRPARATSRGRATPRPPDAARSRNTARATQRPARATNRSDQQLADPSNAAARPSHRGRDPGREQQLADPSNAGCRCRVLPEHGARATASGSCVSRPDARARWRTAPDLCFEGQVAPRVVATCPMPLACGVPHAEQHHAEQQTP